MSEHEFIRYNFSDYKRLSVTCVSRYEELLIWCVLNMIWIINNAVFVFRLNNCKRTEKSCSVLATVLSSKTILKEMNLNNSRLLDSGVKEICEGLKNPVCELNILKWVHLSCVTNLFYFFYGEGFFFPSNCKETWPTNKIHSLLTCPQPSHKTMNWWLTNSLFV